MALCVTEHLSSLNCLSTFHWCSHTDTYILYCLSENMPLPTHLWIISTTCVSLGHYKLAVFFQPLNPNPDSQWSQYFKDNEMLLQIYKDCRRLCPDLAFFQSATPFPCEELVNPSFGMETLKTRVEQTVLKSQNVSKNRHGITTADVSTSSTTESGNYSGNFHLSKRFRPWSK